MKSWLRDYDQYFLHDEILYRALGNRSKSHPEHVILIPSGLQAKIPKTLRVGPLGGHRKRFCWPGMRETITKHIQLCKVATQLHWVTSWLANSLFSGQWITWDRCQKQVVGTNTFKLLLTISPSGACEAFAAPNQKASTVAPILESCIFLGLALQQS